MAIEEREESKLAEKLELWMEEHVVDDLEENMEIAELCMRALKDKWNVGFRHPETILGFYGIVYQTIIQRLAQERENRSSYGVRIRTLEIGYDDAEDDGVMTKPGSFCPYIYDIPESELEDAKLIDMEGTSVERCTEWVSNNLKQQPNLMNEIATAAVKNLADNDIHIAYSVLVFPIFYTIHTEMVQYMKLKREETGDSEKMINFAGAFDVYARLQENGDTLIEYSPVPSDKIGIKSDAMASATKE